MDVPRAIDSHILDVEIELARVECTLRVSDLTLGGYRPNKDGERHRQNPPATAHTSSPFARPRDRPVAGARCTPIAND